MRQIYGESANKIELYLRAVVSATSNKSLLEHITIIIIVNFFIIKFIIII